MRQSQLFTKTRKEAPHGEVARNAQLLIRAGFIDKLHAGVYTLLPLGFRVFKNIERIIREEMTAIGGQEMLMPALHPKENWETTGRWESMDDLYTLTDASDRTYALGATHEEVVVPLAKQFIDSYRDLPFAVFQIQSKFRMELRAKSGILRGKEFSMKDLYSFHADEADLDRYYAIAQDAYARVYERLGIGDRTYMTFAGGGTFSKYSHEYQTVTSAGEDTVYVCDNCKVALNEELLEEQSTCPQCDGEDLRKETAIEVGNIFKLKTKFSDPFDVTYKDKNGESQTVLMGCYGIGLTRALGAIAEVCSDDNGLIWPKEVAPFDYHLLVLPSEDEAVRAEADALYENLTNAGLSVLYDDTDARAGEKFADADLIGIPTRLVVSEKTREQNAIELKERASGLPAASQGSAAQAEETRMVTEAEVLNESYV